MTSSTSFMSMPTSHLSQSTSGVNDVELSSSSNLDLTAATDDDLMMKESVPLELDFVPEHHNERDLRNAANSSTILLNSLSNAATAANDHLGVINNDEKNSNNNNDVNEVQTWNFWNYFNLLNLNKNEIEEIEKNIFKAIGIPIRRFYVNIRSESLKIWTLSANTNEPATNPDNNNNNNLSPLVLVHGFCGGIGLWAHNIEPLAQRHPFYAFDLLGFGRSSRPSFSTDPIVAETQFVESIEDWRKALNLKPMILLGHSFGGYLSTAYALKYPQNVKALILADPWGFPENSSIDRSDTPRPLWVMALAKCSQYVSPLSFIRVTGRAGVSVFKYLRPDFKKKYMNILEDPEQIYDYLYLANRLNPTGEAGFRAIAQYFGFAKNPMIKRIDKVKHNIPIWFIYGSRSWIDSSSGFTAVYLRQRFAPISVKLIINAGHHVYADRPNEFNEYVKGILDMLSDIDNDNEDEKQHQQHESMTTTHTKSNNEQSG